MNKVFKNKWNVHTQTWVATSELAKERNKVHCLTVGAVALTLFSTLGSPNVYAAITTTTGPCDGVTPTCQRVTVKDDVAKTISVTFSGGPTTAGYFPSERDFDHTFINNVNIITPGYMMAAFGAPFTGKIKVDNNAMMRGTGTSAIDFQWARLNNEAIINNAGEISTTGTANEHAIILMGNTGTRNSLFKINNSETNSLIKGRNRTVTLNHADSVEIRNKGTIKSETGYAISIGNTNSVFIQNEGIIESPTTSINNATIYYSANTGNTTILNTGDILNTSGGNTILTRAGNENIISTGGKLVGKIFLGAGNDSVTLSNTDISRLTQLAGSSHVAAAMLATPEDNTLNLHQAITGSSSSSGAINDTKISHWHNLNIGTTGELNLTGDLFFVDTAQPTKVGKIVNNGVINLNAGTSTSTIKYDIVNNNTIDLTKGSTNTTDSMTIEGNYVGGANSKLLVDGTWNEPDTQTSDSLIITGTATGSTTVLLPNSLQGDIITPVDPMIEKNGKFATPVITVKGGDSTQVFTGKTVTANAGEAQLFRRVEGSETKYYWTLNATVPKSNSDPSPKEIVGITPQSIPGYLQSSWINRTMGLDQLSKHHERSGEQLLSNNKKADRTLNTYTRLQAIEGVAQGKNRFGISTRRGLFQVSQDLNITNMKDGHARSGIVISYNWANNKFYDKYRSENGLVTAEKQTGTGRSQMFSLGGYRTWYGNNGSYLDLVGNISFVNNEFSSDQTATQKGYGAGASIEIGRAYQLAEKWSIEPQAQLRAQYIHLGNINDGVYKIDSSDDFTVQARLGARLTNGNLYISTDVLQDVITPKAKITASTIGSKQYEDRYNDTQIEVTFGGEKIFAKKFTLYGNMKYSRALGSNNHVFSSRNARENYTANIGMKYSW